MAITRREAREQAFLLIFEWDFHKQPIDELFVNAAIGRKPEIDEYCRDLVTYTIENINNVDEIITGSATKWKKNRIGKVALATLRTCVGEMLSPNDVPESVSINEAVELCKKYATESDSAFINGVLGAISKIENNKEQVEKMENDKEEVDK